MKLYFMSEEALAYFKGNVSYNLDCYLRESNEWISEKYPDKPLREVKFEIADLSMDMSSERPEATDYNNVKIVYNALKQLNDSQAVDERFWSGLAHSVLWDYMKYRCGFTPDNIDENKVLSRYFFQRGSRSLIINPLARLWWVGRLIYDEKADDPYRALEYLRNNFSSKVFTLFSSNFTNNPQITRAILLAIANIEKIYKKVSREQYYELIRYVNLLGGVIILDYLSEEELQNKIIEHFFDINDINFMDDE